MSMTLMFQRPPFLPQTRTIWTPNNNFLVLGQVTMSREEVQAPKCDIRSVLSPYPLVLPYPLPRYTGACAEKGPAVPELQVQKIHDLYNTSQHQHHNGALHVKMVANEKRAETQFVTAEQQTNPVPQGFVNLDWFIFASCKKQMKKKCKFLLHPYTSSPPKQMRWMKVR